MTHAQKHYDTIAEVYDILEHANNKGETPITNNLLVKQFKDRGVKTVLDMTCGTGMQTIGLAKAGFKVVGSDLSQSMLDRAIHKSAGLDIHYQQADMRTVSLGQFDAIISMFNAIGHLTVKDFEKAVINAYQHLNPGGIYAFDIFNTELIRYSQEYEHIDAVAVVEDTKYVRFTKSRFNQDNNHLEITQKTYIQKKRLQPEIISEHYALQTYTKDQLNAIMDKSGFTEIKITGEGMLDVFGMPGLCHLCFGVKSK